MVLCEIRLVEAWLTRREVVGGARRVISEKLREDRYREGYTRSLEGKRIEGDEINVEHMWGQVKRVMLENAREVCGSERVGGRTQRVFGGTTR